MASRNLDQGIKAIQDGNPEQGARLIKIALREPNLSPENKAMAFVWLAETQQNIEDKIASYRSALQVSPNNAAAQQRLNHYLSQQLPPPDRQQNNPQGNYRQDNRNAPPNDNHQYGQQTQPDFNQFNPQQPPQRGGQYQQPPNDLRQQNTPPPAQRPNDFWQQPPQGGQQPQQNDFWAQSNQPNQPQQGGQQYEYPNQGQQPYNPNSAQQQPNFWDGFNMPATGTNAMDTRQLRAANSHFQEQQFPQQPTIMLQRLQRSVGIMGGPNGNGTGFYLTREGLIATTRFIVGGETRLAILLEDGRQIMGEVVRAFPSFDLALIKANIQLHNLIRVDRNPNIPDGMPLVAVTHSGQGLQSQKRATRQSMESHWIPTLINHLLDAGGNPIFNNQNTLIGMLTKNASRSNGYLYGLHISKIIQLAGQYQQEKQQTQGDTAYCNACGIMSKAPIYGGFFCENCGNTLPFAKDLARYPQRNMISIYGENQQRPCPNCQSQVGFYKGECMRCGYEL